MQLCLELVQKYLGKELDMKITFIGGGNMAQAIISGLLASKNTYDLEVIEPNNQTAELIRNNLKIHVQADSKDISSDIFILATKPKDIEPACKDLNDKKSLYISIAAGISTKKLSRYLKGAEKIVRVMPNLCAFQAKSMNAIYASRLIRASCEKEVDNIFESIGLNLWMQEESHINLATAISGSGPAYIFLFINELINSAIKIGIPKAEAKILIQQTLEGSVSLANKNIDNLNELIKNVSSKGGTTEAAINSLNEDQFGKIIFSAISKAANRAWELDQ